MLASLGLGVSFVANMESISSLGQALYLRYADLLILNSLVLTVAQHERRVRPSTRLPHLPFPTPSPS